MPEGFDEIVVATRNRKKVDEIARMLHGTGIKLLALDEVGRAQGGDCPEVVEDAPDFRGNALKKAREISSCTGRTAIADDSGLVVDALGGRPGVFSARYAGEDATDTDNYSKLLAELEGVSPTDRTARFVCFLALVHVDGRESVFQGVCEGTISKAPQGRSGFGYDPVFIPEGHDRSFAQMSGQEKDSMSHRGRAIRAFAEFVRSA